MSKELFFENVHLIGADQIEDPCRLFDNLSEIQRLLSRETNPETLKPLCDKFVACEWFEAASFVRDRIIELQNNQNEVL